MSQQRILRHVGLQVVYKSRYKYATQISGWGLVAYKAVTYAILKPKKLNIGAWENNKIHKK